MHSDFTIAESGNEGNSSLGDSNITCLNDTIRR